MRYAAVLALFISCLCVKANLAFGDEASSSEDYLVVEDSAPASELAVAEKPAKLATNEYGSTAADAATVLGAKTHTSSYQGSKYSLTPMLGGSFYIGRWAPHIGNAFTLGLILENRLSQNISAELEGSFGSYNITYSMRIHDFRKIALGLNGKVYLLDGALRPYLGAGLMAIHYENMYSGTFQYNKLVGAPQLLVGTDFALLSGVDVGVRGAWVIPAIGLPESRGTGGGSAPGFEEATAIQKDFVRVMGTVKVAL